MLEAIRDHFFATGIRIGMKPAGGIRTAKQALTFLVAVKETLGDAWLNNTRYRFGASALLNDLVRAYPDNPKLDQAAYLLGNLAQEQQRYDEAVEIFKRITTNWAESPVAPDAQFHVGDLLRVRPGESTSWCSAA